MSRIGNIFSAASEVRHQDRIAMPDDVRTLFNAFRSLRETETRLYNEVPPSTWKPKRHPVLPQFDRVYTKWHFSDVVQEKLQQAGFPVDPKPHGKMYGALWGLISRADLSEFHLRLALKDEKNPEQQALRQRIIEHTGIVALVAEDLKSFKGRDLRADHFKRSPGCFNPMEPNYISMLREDAYFPQPQKPLYKHVINAVFG